MNARRRRGLSEEDRGAILHSLQNLPPDADAVDRIDSVFLPLPNHAMALAPNIYVVRGERGAGKSALFHLLQKLRSKPDALNRLFKGSSIPPSTWLDGFAESGNHPSAMELDQFVKQATDEEVRLFWLGHLCRRLIAGGTPQGELPRPLLEALTSGNTVPPGDLVTLAKENLNQLARWLDSIETYGSGENYTVSYDHLDRIGLWNRTTRERFVGTLLALWLSLANRHTRLRAKIFVREDLFEASESAFPDAAKLRARSVSLSWDVPSLYRLLIRYVAQQSDVARKLVCHDIDLRKDPDFGWMPPDGISQDEIQNFVKRLANPQMGSGVKKGFTWRWIPNHLQDANRRIVPRSIIGLISYAAQHAIIQGKHEEHPLMPVNLQAGLEDTSKTRAIQLTEEHKVVARLENLRNSTLLITEAQARRLLSKPSNDSDGFEADGAAVVRELHRLGVLARRTDGRIDVPDIYRFGFGIKRKGGIARPI